jgi:hypothetical protein
VRGENYPGSIRRTIPTKELSENQLECNVFAEGRFAKLGEKWSSRKP